MNMLAISGSLQSHSSDSALLRAATAQRSQGVEILVFERLGDLSHFKPDLDGACPPESAAALRSLAGAADALLIASPEYAHEMPGSSRMRSIGSYPPASCTASPPPSYAIAVKRTLEAAGGRVVLSTTIAMRRSSDGTPTLDPAAAGIVERALQSLRSASAT
jgi:hypothetical protein